MQRKNVNVFNKLTGSIYHIFNTYNLKKLDDLPKYFGLDPKNRVYPILKVEELKFDVPMISISFVQQRPHIEIQGHFDKIHTIFFNKTRISMYYVINEFSGMLSKISVENSNEWKEDDEICIYVAISSSNWLGNFVKLEF